LRAAGPEAPTLCEGWKARDLAAHVWLREHRPVTLAGSFIPALSDWSDQQFAQTKAARPFPELVDAFQAGPGRWSPYRIRPLNELANGAEYFIHCEDVRRGGPHWEPRELDPATAGWAWGQVKLFARLKLRGAPVSVVLENSDTGATLHVGRRPRVVTVAGPPAELLLWLAGRREAARVSLSGTTEALEALAGVDLRQ
jgi:uncharacterized protein (TIGR03085 family)